MIASTVALLLVSAGFVAYELITCRQTMATDISTLGTIIGDRSTATLSFGKPDEAWVILGALKIKEHITGAALYDKDGKLFTAYRSANSPKEYFPARPEMDGTRFEGDRLVFFKRVYDAGDLEGTICVKSDLEELDQRFTRYAGIILLFTVASLLVTLFLSSR